MAADLAQVLNAVVDDPEVKDALKQLALTALAEAEHTLERGHPQIKMQLIRTLLPPLVASLKEAPADQNADEMKTRMENLFVAMRDGMPSRGPST